MGEEGRTPQQHVRLAAGELLESLQQRFINLLRAEIVDEVIIVDSNLPKPKEDNDE